MYKEFLGIAEKLNSELDIIPLLYGSLGLQKITNIDFNSDDIDMLIPKKYLNDKWNVFKETIEGLSYELIDLHEHTFVKDEFKIAFADIESLVSFAGIDIENIENKSEESIKYKILNLEQYLKVYLQSSKDGYRKVKNNNKDFLKIKTIKRLLDE